jgi:hypothetical protein
LQFSRRSDIRQSFAPIGLQKTDAASDWLLIKRHYLGKKGLPGDTKIIGLHFLAIGVILAFTGKNMFYFNQNRRCLLKIQ